MVESTEKAPDIDNLLHRLFKVDRVSCVEANECTLCPATNVTFRDALSVKEYRISGMCQGCQDRVWG
jgi:hypothetical protein